VILVAFALGARPPDPPPPRPTPRPPQPSVWQQIQPALNRSTGRILDETSYEVGRLNYQRDARLGLVPTLRDAEILRVEQERRLRIDQRNRRIQQTSERARREELDRREYEMSLYSGLYAASADEQALAAAKAARDAAIIEADNQRLDQLRARPNDQPRLDAEYMQKLKEIRQRYDNERGRIFGMPSGPTTQPTP
jgi:hypothetical protein